MDIHLRSGSLYLNGTAPSPGIALLSQVVAASATATRRSKIAINNFDQIRGVVSGDPVIRNGGFVVLNGSDGNFLAFENTGADRLVNDPTVTSPRQGLEVLRILLSGAIPGQPIADGDTVLLEAIPLMRAGLPNATPFFASLGAGGGIVFVRSGAGVPGAAELFTFVVPPDLTGFTFPADADVTWDGRCDTTGTATIGAPAILGGSVLDIGTRFVRPSTVPFSIMGAASVVQGLTSVAIPIPAMPLPRDPGGGGALELLVAMQWSGTSLTQTVQLHPQPVPFLRIVTRMVVAPDLGGCLPGMIPILPLRTARFAAFCELQIVADDPEIAGQTLPLAVTLRARPDGSITNLVQDATEVDADRPIPFRFDALRPRRGNAQRELLVADFTLSGFNKSAYFEVIIHETRLEIDPR